MKRVGNETATHDPDGGREEAVQSRPPAIGAVASNRKIGVRALGESVHSSVGAASAVNANAFATDLREGVFQVILNAIAV